MHGRKATDLKLLVIGDRVLMRTDNEPHWTEGRVLAEVSQPKFYIVDTGSNQLRMNRTHLKSVLHMGNGVELETAHIVMETPGVVNRTEVPSSPVPSTPTPSPQRRACPNCGTLPKRLDGFEMN